MSSILFLRGFNNYHRRTIIKYSSLDDYKNNSASFLNFDTINFNPNDGITTELIVGGSTQKENNDILKFDSLGSPDYLVVYETVSSVNTIVSRWFILDCTKTTAGQFRLALKRDLIADNLDWIVNSDCFIEKGQVMDDSSPFLFNNESMTYNQIKKKEVPLYDSTGVSWIVGYIAKNFPTNLADGKDLEGQIINQDAAFANAYEMADLPWGSLTPTQINNGITFRTVESVNIFPIVGLNTFSYADDYSSPKSQNLLCRCAMVNNNGNYALYNNYGLYFRTANPTLGQSSNTLLDIQGPGLGFFTDAWTNEVAIQRLMPNFPFSSPGDVRHVSPSVYESTLTSAQDIANTYVSQIGSGALSQLWAEMVINSGVDFTGPNAIQSLDGKAVRVSDGNGGYDYYTIRIQSTVNNIGADWWSFATTASKSTLKNKLLTTVRALDTRPTWGSTNADIKIRPIYADITIKFLAIPPTLKVNAQLRPGFDYPGSYTNRWGCNDQLFDVFCIPYGAIPIKENVNGTWETITTRADAGLAAARAIAKAAGQSLYDLQILPYCPIKEIRDSFTTEVSCFMEIDGTQTQVEPYLKRDGYVELDFNDTSIFGSAYEITDASDTTTIYSFLFWATLSHGTIDLPIMSSDNKYYQYATAIDEPILKKKISNETEIFRLCSPNYNGLFEYSAAKNNNFESGSIVTENLTDVYQPDIEYINVDYTYRPGNPYIHLNPIFKGEEQGAIYGKDWNDVRGLICGGDFSLGYIVDAFRSYQIQNANFQNIFDRQIQNIDSMNALAQEQMKLSNVSNVIALPTGGAVTGAMAGAKVGGGWGAVAGGAVGLSGGLAGGIAGFTLNEEWLNWQQRENKQYAIDMYNYNLGNIKALPYSISRTDCLAENTRLVPFLEVYESTEAEINNLMNVIKYNGMTVMTIDKPINYLGSASDDTYKELAVSVHDQYCYYIKARLIMNPDTDFSGHFQVVNAIYDELNKGIYLQGK